MEDDLRDLRTSMDQKLDRLDAKPAAGFERQDTKLATMLQQLGARSTAQDERFERQDAKHVILLEKLDARVERQDERFERRDAKLDARFERLEGKIDRIDAKFESKLEAMSTRRFTVWVTVITSVATVAAAVLALMFSGPHGH